MTVSVIFQLRLRGPGPHTRPLRGGGDLAEVPLYGQKLAAAKTAAATATAAAGTARSDPDRRGPRGPFRAGWRRGTETG